MFVVVEISGSQYKVSEGDKLLVDLFEEEEGTVIKNDKVLLYSPDNEDDSIVGSPYVDGAEVEFKILGMEKGDKIRVFKMKPKKRYSKTIGHRQKYSEIEILKIKKSGTVKASKAKKEVVEEKAEVKVEKGEEKKEQMELL